MTRMTLETLGWNGRRQAEFEAHAVDGLAPGRVVGEHRSHFRVATDAIELTAEAAGRLRNAAGPRSDLPGVGDFVGLRLAAGDGPATIEAILPRTSALVRTASGETRPQLLAANIDIVFIVTAPDGDFNLPRLERYLALVRDSGAAPVIVLNKVDLAGDLTGQMLAQIAGIAPGLPAHAIRARDPDGVRALEGYFAANRTVVLVGSSGVGKSTLTNRLLGREAQATQEVRAHDNRGRHTTTHRQLFTRPHGGAIIDTPGIRGVAVWTTVKDLGGNFDDIEALAAGCRFRNCRHESEPKCAVRDAVKQGNLDAARLAAYVTHARAVQLSAC